MINIQRLGSGGEVGGDGDAMRIVGDGRMSSEKAQIWPF